jgi:hypothetical protein
MDERNYTSSSRPNRPRDRWRASVREANMILLLGGTFLLPLPIVKVSTPRNVLVCVSLSCSFTSLSHLQTRRS